MTVLLVLITISWRFVPSNTLGCNKKPWNNLDNIDIKNYIVIHVMQYFRHSVAYLWIFVQIIPWKWICCGHFPPSLVQVHYKLCICCAYSDRPSATSKGTPKDTLKTTKSLRLTKLNSKHKQRVVSKTIKSKFTKKYKFVRLFCTYGFDLQLCVSFRDISWRRGQIVVHET